MIFWGFLAASTALMVAGVVAPNVLVFFVGLLIHMFLVAFSAAGG